MRVPRVLPYRLRRKPSLLGEIAPRLGLTVAWNGLFGGLMAVAWMQHRQETPGLVFALLGFMVLFGLGLIWDVAARMVRMALDRTTIVEIDQQPVRPGRAVKVRICEPHPSSFETLEVDLVRTVRTVTPELTAIRDVPETTPFAAVHEDLAGPAALDRTFELRLPSETPAGTVRWRLYVSGRLKQGGVLIAGFALPVQSS